MLIRTRSAAVLSASLLAVAALGGGCSQDHSVKGETEIVQVPLSDAPTPVQQAVMRDFPGGQVVYVGKHDMGAGTHYHVEVKMPDGKTVYHTYSPSGTDMSDRD